LLNGAILDATELEPTGVGSAKLLTEADDNWLLLGTAIGVSVAAIELVGILLLDETTSDSTEDGILVCTDLEDTRVEFAEKLTGIEDDGTSLKIMLDCVELKSEDAAGELTTEETPAGLVLDRFTAEQLAAGELTSD
jgi:hypothetical protein